MAKLLEVKNLETQFTTSGGVVRAVDRVSWDVEEGETVALVGESGCGKSVSALSVMRLVSEPAGRIVGGEILFKGRDLLKLPEEQMRDVRGREICIQRRLRTSWRACPPVRMFRSLRKSSTFGRQSQSWRLEMRCCSGYVMRLTLRSHDWLSLRECPREL